MKVRIKTWNAVASWRWDVPEDDVCGICRVQFDGTCPNSLRQRLDLDRELEGLVSHVSAEV
ncbi:uncharacterized protein H6S33_011830 [Morchella sextelata]|uniref:uncharacterized protein n=1 Tax=Morchella sextelata TaxID=1174677 RepID=UPI001D043343|nr:uncharacterized protein H6S33_011830 [Morchella sextelata]KAH0610303.1 hypothetical protein H6S33_011830 [Morchella sextelata]